MNLLRVKRFVMWFDGKPEFRLLDVNGKIMDQLLHHECIIEVVLLLRLFSSTGFIAECIAITGVLLKQEKKKGIQH